MRPFSYSQPSNVSQALAAGNGKPAAKYLGGGTNLIDLMKMGIESPSELIDVTRLPLAQIEEHSGGIRIGACARNSETAAHPLILRGYPLLSHAILSGASAQIRNMATIGGNLLQRTRCYYFYDPTYTQCNKRTPGSGCAAMEGYNRIHAIVGVSDRCIAAYPGDMAVALAALDAQIVLHDAAAERTVPIDQFYRLPGETPHIETGLMPGELIVAVELPAETAGWRSYYVKVRDRNSYAFALVSVAAALDVGADGRIRDVRVALGGVAPTPWRAHETENMLRNQAPSEESFRKASAVAVRDVKTRRHNAFKVELAQRAVARALAMAWKEPV